MRLPLTGFKRLCLCIGAIMVLVFYVTAAASIPWGFNFPIPLIGLLIMSAYSWYVSTKFKGIYPLPSKAIGQLSLIFFLCGYGTSKQFEQFKKTIPNSNSSIDDLTYAATIYHSEVMICSTMAMALFILYLIFKRKERKANKEQRNI